MKTIHLILSATVLAITLATAQEPPAANPERGERGPRRERSERAGPRPAPRGERELMMQSLFPAELVRRHAEQLDLTEDQKSALKEEMTRAREQFEPKQKEVRTQIQALAELLKPAKVDQAAVTAQLDKVMAAEEAIKREHLLLLVRIKNLLSPEQQAKLAEMRQTKPPPRPQRPPRQEPPPPAPAD